MFSRTQLLLLVLLSVFAFFGVYFPLTNTDIWWHLAAGRSLLQDGSFLASDPFSLSSANQPWINLHWFFQASAYLAWSVGGHTALVIGKCILFTAGIVILLKASETKVAEECGSDTAAMRPVGIAILALTILAGRHLVFARPVVFTLIYMSLFFFLLARFSKSKKPGPLLGLIVVQIFWANTQALFPLGPVILGCFLAGEGAATIATKMKIPGFLGRLDGKALAMLAASLFLVSAASLLTPYGWETLRIPFQLFGRIEPGMGKLFTWNVSENIPPWALERMGPGPVTVFKWIGLAAAASFLLNLKRISLSRLFVLLAMLIPALMANRNILLFYWAAAYVSLVNVGCALCKKSTDSPSRLSARLIRNPLLSIGMVFLLALPLGFTLYQEGPISKPSPFRVPTEAVHVINELPGDVRLFNSVRYGGYLIWNLYPEAKPYIDGRLVLRSHEQFSKYLQALDRPETFEHLDAQFDFTAALLPVTKPDRYQNLIAYLVGHPRWHLVFTDGTETLFVKGSEAPYEALDLSSPPVVDKIVAAIISRFAQAGQAREQALIHLGLLLNLAGQPGQAENVLTPLESRGAKNLLARTLVLNQKPLEARSMASDLLKSDPEDIDSLLLLTWIAYNTGNLEKALGHARLALKLDPHSIEAKRILQNLQDRLR